MQAHYFSISSAATFDLEGIEAVPRGRPEDSSVYIYIYIYIYIWQCLITFAVGRLKKMGSIPGGT
jgi:hypothetical protein